MQEVVILSIYFLLASDKKEEQHTAGSMLLFSDDYKPCKGYGLSVSYIPPKIIWFGC